MSKMTKWEYKVATSDSAYEDGLNKLGKQGWELVAVVKSNYSAVDYEYVFKRPIIPKD